MIRIVLAHDRGEGLKRLDVALRKPREETSIRPGMVLQEVLAGNWIQKQDLWGPDAAAFVERLVKDPDPRIDDETRTVAQRLLLDRATEAAMRARWSQERGEALAPR